MRNRLYGGVRGRKMKVGGNYFIFLLLDLYSTVCILFNDYCHPVVDVGFITILYAAQLVVQFG